MKLPKFSKKTRISLAVLVVVAVGALGLAVKTGKIKIKADTTPQKISGTVYDTHGNKLKGVKITDNFGHLTYTAQYPAAGTEGQYTLSNLPTEEVSVTYAWPYLLKSVPSFSDVPKTYWAFNEIESVKYANILNGYPDRTFKPTVAISRNVMAILLARSLGLTPYNNRYPTFKDVTPTTLGYQEIEALVKDGDISGYSDGTFHPNEIVNRAQIAAFLAKALRLDTPAPAISSFSDVPQNYWAIAQIEAMKAEGIIGGYGDGTFRPDQQITRDQLAVFLVRSFRHIQQSQNGLLPVTKKFYLTANKQAKMDIYLPYSYEMGKIFGSAKDRYGVPFPGVKVVLTQQPAVFEEYSRTADSKGNFRFYNVPASSYAYYILKKDSVEAYQNDNWENMAFVKNGLNKMDLTISDIIVRITLTQ